MRREPKAVRQASKVWRHAAVQAVLTYEQAGDNGMIGTLVDTLTELVETERLDAVRLDRQRRVPVAHEVILTKIEPQADLADRVLLLETSLRALANHAVFNPPTRKTPRARKKARR